MQEAHFDRFLFRGTQRRCGHTFLPRHEHRSAYLAVVISGEYEEAGDRGRVFASAGDVVTHGPFEAHLNRYAASNSEVLNLPLPPAPGFHSALMRVTDPDAVLHLAKKSIFEALEFLVENTSPQASTFSDWPDELANDLLRCPDVRLDHWAREHLITDAALSRGFRRVFGITPSAFRARSRAKAAWERVAHSIQPLASIAAELGFADQAHMTRSIGALTGRTPGSWRGKVK